MPKKLDSCVQQVMERDDMKKRYPDTKMRERHAFAICRSSTGLDDGESPHMGYITDLTTLKFDDDPDDSLTRWVHMMPAEYHDEHPLYGPIEITPEKVTQFADSVNNSPRGISLDIDYEHKNGPDGGRAAGWLVKAEARLDDEPDEKKRGLWGLISFTKRAFNEIKAGEWKYFSPEFDWSWKASDGTEYQNVVFGGALTNRPFLKNLLPINLSEYEAAIELEEEHTSEEVNGLDLKEILQALGLSEDAKKEDVLARVQTLESAAKAKLQDDAAAKKFEEDYPEQAAALKAIETEREDTAKKFRSMETATKLSEWSSGKLQLSEKNDKGEEVTKTVTKMIPPALNEDLKAYRDGLPEDQIAGFDKLVEGFLAHGVPDAGVTGSSDTGSSDEPTGDNPVEEFSAKVEEEKKIAASENGGKGITFREATVRATKKHPQLHEAWRDSAVRHTIKAS